MLIIITSNQIPFPFSPGLQSAVLLQSFLQQIPPRSCEAASDNVLATKDLFSRNSFTVNCGALLFIAASAVHLITGLNNTSYVSKSKWGSSGRSL